MSQALAPGQIRIRMCESFLTGACWGIVGHGNHPSYRVVKGVPVGSRLVGAGLEHGELWLMFEHESIPAGTFMDLNAKCVDVRPV